ncbi:KilA-N domain-containing protein [Salmonella enterica subsp. enterica]
MTTSQGASRDIRYYTLNYDQMMLVGITVKRQKNLEVQNCTSKKIDSAFKQMHKVVQFMLQVIKETDMKEIELEFNNTITKLSSDEEGLFNLNDLWKLSGEGESRKPNRWVRSNYEFLERQIWRSKRGRGITGTYGSDQVVYAYASWISPEFHAAVIEAFTNGYTGD